MSKNEHQREIPMEVRERYVNFYTDFAFKKLFGTEANKDLLMAFLNALFDGRKKINHLTYLNGEQLGRIATDRKAIFDVYCETGDGEKILIEMQKTNQEYFKDRSLYYSTFPIQEQAVKGNWNFRLNQVYVLGILNFCFDDTDANYLHHEVKLLDTKTHSIFYDKLTYIYLEMPKFRKTEAELQSNFDKWLYATKNLCTLLERPKVLQDAVFQRFFEQAEIAGFTPEEQLNYRESQKDYWDMFSVTETAKKEGLTEGLEKGLKQGREEGEAIGRKAGIEEGKAIGLEKGREEGEKKVFEIARQLKQMKIPVTQITQATGLCAEEIEEL